MIVTTTPRPTRIVKALAADPDTIVTRGSTFDNKGHLARAFLKRIASATRAARSGGRSCSPRSSRRRRAPCGPGR